MNRFAITRKLTLYAWEHPKVLAVYLKVINKTPTLPKGYRKIMKK